MHPPVHILVAQYLGYKPISSSAAPAAQISDDQFHSLVELMPNSEPEPFLTQEEYLARKGAFHG